VCLRVLGRGLGLGSGEPEIGHSSSAMRTESKKGETSGLLATASASAPALFLALRSALVV